MTKTSKHILPWLISFITAILLMSGIFAVRASAETSGDYKFYISSTGNTVVITNYTGTATEITIPSELGGYPVTAIGVEAFRGCTGLKSITIGNNVAEINYLWTTVLCGKYAPYILSQLPDVNI